MNRENNMKNNFLENLKDIKMFLPKGYTKIIAKEIGTTEMTVSNALQGKTRRYDIIEKAIELAEANKHIAMRLNEFVNK